MLRPPFWSSVTSPQWAGTNLPWGSPSAAIIILILLLLIIIIIVDVVVVIVIMVVFIFIVQTIINVIVLNNVFSSFSSLCCCCNNQIYTKKLDYNIQSVRVGGAYYSVSTFLCKHGSQINPAIVLQSWNILSSSTDMTEVWSLCVYQKKINQWTSVSPAVFIQTVSGNQISVSHGVKRWCSGSAVCHCLSSSFSLLVFSLMSPKYLTNSWGQ